MSRTLSGLPLRAARWSATHPWRAIGAWLAFVVVAVGLSATVSTNEVVDADYRVGESGRAAALVERAGLDTPPTENVLVSAREGRLDPATARAAADELAGRMRALPGVADVDAPLANDDGTALLLSVALRSDDVDAGPLVAATAAVQRDHPDLRVEQAGDVTIGDAVDERVGEDLRSAELISLPITLVLMLLAFGALVAAGLPVLLAATSVAATIGISAPISYLVPAEPTVASMIVLIGMAVGVDYSLFYLKRERQERAAGRSTLDAVAIAAETSGHAILVSGGAVIASLAALFVLTDVTFDSLATGAILVVAVAVLGSVTVLPALLVKLGRWVDRPRVPLLWRLTRRVGAGTLSGRLLGPVVRHPVAALVAAGLVLGALAVPALSMRTHQSGVETLPRDIAEVQTLHRITRAFPAEGTSAEVVVSGVDAPTLAPRLDALEAAAQREARFGEGRVRTSADGRTSVLTLALPYEESDDRAARAIERLRDRLVPSALAELGPGAEVAVGGDAAAALDHADRQGARMPLLLAIVLLLTMAMMVLAFRSVLLGAVSTLLNLVSVGVAFGLLSLVFQHGVGAGLLDFTSPGFVIDWIPIFVLVVLVGLSMDYHVFVLSRVRELVDRGLPARDAVHRGIADTAGVITSAAAVMVSVFAIFATLSMMEMKMMGVGLAAAILVDATVIRLVVLPAVLVLLGERAWPPAPARGPRRIGRGSAGDGQVARHRDRRGCRGTARGAAGGDLAAGGGRDDHLLLTEQVEDQRVDGEPAVGAPGLPVDGHLDHAGDPDGGVRAPRVDVHRQAEDTQADHLDRAPVAVARGTHGVGADQRRAVEHVAQPLQVARDECGEVERGDRAEVDRRVVGAVVERVLEGVDDELAETVGDLAEVDLAELGAHRLELPGEVLGQPGHQPAADGQVDHARGRPAVLGADRERGRGQ